MNRREVIARTAAGAVWLAINKTAVALDPDVQSLLKKAERLIMEADDQPKLGRLIKAYQKVLEVDPDNYEALWSLGRYCSLMALAYEEDINEKDKLYLGAIDYCERGLRTNPEFEALLAKGDSVPGASRVLTRREIAALFYWYAGGAGRMNECMQKNKQIFFLFRNLRGNKKIMKRMMEIDPEWGGGHPYFTWAAYYCIVPRLLGGSLKKAEWYFERAIEAGPEWLYIKYGRALYFHTRKNNRQGFVSDLEWVLSKDPKAADSPYPANVYFQRSAKEMLARADEIFG